MIYQLAHVMSLATPNVIPTAMFKKEKLLVNALASQMLKVKIVTGANQIIGILTKVIH